MIFPKKFLGCPPFLGYICWPKVAGVLLLLSAPLPYFLSGVPGKSYGFDHRLSEILGDSVAWGYVFSATPPKRKSLGTPLNTMC